MRHPGCQPSRNRPARAVAAFLLVAAIGPTTTTAAPATQAAADSTLGFRALRQPGDRFSVSDLTRAYERDWTLWMNADRQPAVDLAWLDRHGVGRPGDRPASASHSAADADSSDIDVVDGARATDPNALTPGQKAETEAPKAPVSVGIPSSVATAGTLVGGLALLVKLIAGLAK